MDRDLTKKRFSSRRKQLERDLEHVTREMYKRNRELAETNQTLSLLRNIDTLVLESDAAIELLCSQISESISATAGFPFVAILVHRPHFARLDLMGWAAKEPAKSKLPEADQMRRFYIETTLPWLKSRSPSAHILRTNHLRWATIHEYLNCPRDVAEQLHKEPPFDSLYVAKLEARNRLVGLMAVGFLGHQEEMLEGTRKLLDRLAQAVGVAVDSRLLSEENQRILKQLEKSNEKLKELDQAKDEFISMASHQLRTPLTSMKGYVSMVLEGDAGKVSASQRKLLEQSFASAQRMVYLIADLLNVSRLKTGKFVIDRTPTNLAELVQSETEQLVETATAKGLKLLYKKPKKFPLLMLDETKIRQVVMNFMDNAIYYTPEGGTITVEALETDKSVQVTITDTGLGVPKADQKHLFSKFFRAGNARKARPDGTGLGLFMAKKVVIAQGGAIIFHSKEGEGSTFGFSFPKKKLMAHAIKAKKQ